MVALFIVKESVVLLKKAFFPLIDTSWGSEEIKKLEERLVLMKVSYHDLRTRIAGNYRFVDIHIEIPADESVGNAHSYCDMIEDELKSLYENLTVTIHVEPEEKENS